MSATAQSTSACPLKAAMSLMTEELGPTASPDSPVVGRGVELPASAERRDPIQQTVASRLVRVDSSSTNCA